MDTVSGILTDIDIGTTYEVFNENLTYYRQNNKVFEEVNVIQKVISRHSDTGISIKLLYRNHCEIGYPLFIKPIKAGSSYGITKVSDCNGLPAAIHKAFEYDEKIIMEVIQADHIS